MFCKSCGALIDPDSKFCDKCGETVSEEKSTKAAKPKGGRKE